MIEQEEGVIKEFDAYLYGLIVRTNAFLLCNNFPEADTYNELREKHIFPGGETGTAATILASLGLSVKIDGNHGGYNTADTLKNYYNKIGVDISAIYFDPNYEGLEDYIIIDKNTRTIFGMFETYFRDCYEKNIIRWNTPSEKDIIKAKVAGIDTYFGEQSLIAAKYCSKHNVPFVTIDTKPNNDICNLASIIVVSSEYIKDKLPNYYSDNGKANLIKEFAKETNALIILTGGNGNIFFGRNGEVNVFPAYKVETISTLGAGDTFKASCIYGLLQSWEDTQIVKFAAGCAAIACTRFPLIFNSPKVDEVNNFIGASNI